VHSGVPSSVIDRQADTEADQVSGPRAVVAGHGQFAAGLASAVQQIAGKGDALIAISNTGLGAADIESLIAAAIDRSGSRVVFTDLPAGSCTIAVRRLQRVRPDIVLVTGVNLATALEYVFRSPDESAVSAATAAAEKGRATLLVHGGHV
jgi:PTS system N-acetylgalactosamine-specific IIA component